MPLTINEIVARVPQWQGKEIDIEPLSGGTTNINYKIIVSGSSFFVSISGHNSQLLGIDWHNKFYNTSLCAEQGLSPKIVKHFPHQRALVQEFLPFALCSVESLTDSGVQHRLVQALKVLHYGADFRQDFDMFCLIKFYVVTITEQGLALPSEYAAYNEKILKIGDALAAYRENLVPCHNDLVPENVMDTDNRVFLLDFDYSGNNDPCFDLGSISVEAGYDDTQTRELAKAYYGHASENVTARIHLHGILADVGWSLWSVIQAEISDIAFDFIKYGLMRWNRAGKKIDSDKPDKWLHGLLSK
ncbi:MAG: phosphotransferase [Desulfobacterales bacterium]|nr:phosphotransferase [Desulfobacterales bacterium]